VVGRDAPFGPSLSMTEASQPMPIVYRIDRRGALERSEHPSLNPAPLLSNSWCAAVRESGGPGG